jgi:DNA-directed RNA polymerase specialized sigma subunit
LPNYEADRAGRIGLEPAILRFDPYQGHQFSTYADPEILHAIWQTVKDHRRENQRVHYTKEVL